MLRKSIYSVLILLLFACAPQDSEPIPGSDDCYNRVTRTCNEKYPNNDYGDKVYRDCIKGGLDWCDKYEPSNDPPLPILKNGRFEISHISD